MCKSVGKHQMPWSWLFLLAKDWANHHFILHREGIQSILQYPLRDFGQLMVTSPSALLQWKCHGEVASVLGNSTQVMLTQVTAAKLSGGRRLEVGAREGERQGWKKGIGIEKIKSPYTYVYSFQKKFKADSDNNISKKENLRFGQQRRARNPHLSEENVRGGQSKGARLLCHVVNDCWADIPVGQGLGALTKIMHNTVKIHVCVEVRCAMMDIRGFQEAHIFLPTDQLSSFPRPEQLYFQMLWLPPETSLQIPLLHSSKKVNP